MDDSVADDQFDEAAFDRNWPADEYEIIGDSSKIKFDKELGVVVRLSHGKSIVSGLSNKFFLRTLLPAGCSMSALTDAVDQHLLTLGLRRKPNALVNSTLAELMVRGQAQPLDPTLEDAGSIIAQTFKRIATRDLVRLVPDVGGWPLHKVLLRVALKIVEREQKIKPKASTGPGRTPPFFKTCL